MTDVIGWSAMDLPLIFIGGLLGSSHCVGMCGGFAVAVGYGTERISSNLARQVIWSSGRIFTYAFGGSAAGFLSSRMSGQWSFASLQGVLALLAGTLLVVQGLLSSGVIRRRSNRAGQCSAGGVPWLLPVGRMLHPAGGRQPRRIHPMEIFLAGVMTGFLPCGLVYAYLALAGASAHLLSGMAIMVAFGIGTMPIMIATGAGASLMSLSLRARMFKVAAWCVFATGLLTMGRGVAAFQIDPATEQPRCPLCQEAPVVKSGTPTLQ